MEGLEAGIFWLPTPASRMFPFPELIVNTQLEIIPGGGISVSSEINYRGCTRTSFPQANHCPIHICPIK